MPLRFERLRIPEVVLVEPKVSSDERGFFMEAYKRSEFAAFGIAKPFVQDNHSRSTRGVLRGLHYQNPPMAQAKLVRVVVGEIFDVAVDIRKGSPTYARGVSVMLSAENKHMLYIPPGFAHGFCVVSLEAEVVYKTTAEYAPDHEAGIVWNDPEIGIAWPIHNPIVSPKDAQLPSLREAKNGFSYGS
ncbi:TPA: dTDP-4-dehydrorhamnose 3,5-epimerase [Candidatus Acetothermia bacterium]|nr:dTDP-4-dehydrorhamnose 3,5-epimerase [Candidatus Acetothermia bacterium]